MPKITKNRSIASVQADKNKLRLYFRHPLTGKPTHLYLGLTDNRLNRNHAKGLAYKLELDILSGNFDASLEKYRLITKKEQSDARTVTDLLRGFEKKRSPNVHKRTLATYRNACDHLINFLGEDVAIGTITSKTAQKFIDLLISKSYSKASIQTYRQSLRAIWKSEVPDRDNVWDDLKLNKLPVAKEPKPLSQSEIRAILEFSIDTKYYDCLYTLFATGMRIGELLGSKFSCVDWVNKTLRLDTTIVKNEVRPPKAGKIRVIPLNERLIALFLARKKVANSDLIFGDIKHLSLSKFWAKTLLELGLEHRKLYSTRSSFVSNAVEKGVSIMTICAITGHSKDVMMRHYLAQTSKPTLPDLF